MKKIDPNSYAAGIGAAAGAYLMSSNDDPLSMASGAIIGGVTGLAGTYTLPSYEAMLSTNQGLSLPKQAASSLQIQQVREKILSRANTILNTSPSTFTGEFDPSKPFTTLGNNLDDLSSKVYGTSDLVELRRISNALAQRTDSVGLNLNDIKLGISQASRGMKIDENSSESFREQAFKDYLKNNMGYVNDAEIQTKFERFKVLLNKEGSHFIKEDKLFINGMEPINLYGKVGTGDNTVNAHISNGIVNIATDVNPMGSAILERKPVSVVAEALGLKITDAFNLQEMMQGTSGMSPDDFVAMAASSENISPEALNKLIKDTNSSLMYDANLTSQLRNTGNRAQIEPGSYQRNIQGKTDFGLTFNFEKDSDHLANLETPVRPLGLTASRGQPAEITRLGRQFASTLDFNTKEGVKPDFATQFVNQKFERTLANLESQPTRNTAAAIREHVATKRVTNNLDHITTQLIDSLGLDMQLGGTVAVPRFSTDINKYNPIAASILGSDVSLADGFSIGNKKITRGIEMSQTEGISFLPNKEGNYGIAENETLSKILKGEITLAEVQENLSRFSSKDNLDQLGKKALAKESDSAFIASVKEQIRIAPDNRETIIEEARKAQAIAKQQYKDLNFKADRVVGYTADGLPIRTGKAFNKYEVKGVHLQELSNGQVRLDLEMNATTSVGNQNITKLFGMDTKTQLRHLGTEDFTKAGIIAEMVNRGDILEAKGGFKTATGIHSLEKMQDLFSKPVKEILSSDMFSASESHYRALAQSFKNDIGIITDQSDSGQNVFHKIKDSLAAGENKVNMDQRLFSMLEESYALNRSPEGLTSTAKLGAALTSSKTSSSTVLEALAFRHTELTTRLSSLKQSIFSGRHTDSQVASVVGLAKTLQIDLTGLESLSRTDLSANRMVYHTAVEGLDGKFQTFAQNTIRYFNDPLLKLQTLAEAPSTYHQFASLFNTGLMENISLSLSTPQLNSEGILGSSNVGAAMSHNAQLQLMYSGLTKEDLSLFGAQDRNKVTDLHSLLSMKEISKTSINSQLPSTNLEGVIRAINSSAETRRDNLREVGIKIDNNYGSYNLSHQYNGLKSIPIPLEDSSIFSSYVDPLSGEKKNTGAINLISNIIRLDQEMTQTSNPTSKSILQGNLEGLIDRFENISRDHLFSKSNPLPKASMALQSPRTLSSNVASTAGTIDRFLDGRKVQKLHQSFGEVSQEGALTRLRVAGYKVKDVNDLMENFTEEVTAGGVKVRRLMLSANQPFYSLTNREPATGPGSIRMMEYIVNSDIKVSDNSLRISWRDMLYAKLQFGDHDADHVTEFFPKAPKANEIGDLYKKMVPITEDFTRLQAYGDMLGVKNKGKAVLPSSMDFLTGNDYEQAIGRYLENFQISNEQAGLRKRVAPAATMLAGNISNSLASMNLSYEDQSTARVLNHYSVENLIKSAHGDASHFIQTGSTQVEQLSQARNNFVNNKDPSGTYLKDLRSYLNDMLLDGASEEVKTSHARAVDNIVQAERLYATSDLTSTMGMGKSKYKTMIEVLGDIHDVVSGNNSAISTMPTEAIETPVDARAKKSYNEISKTVQRNIIENKKVLGIGAGALLATAILTQKQPDFSGTKAEANPSAMMLRPAQETLSQSANSGRGAVEGISMGRATDYLLPSRRTNTYVEGSYGGNNITQDMKNSIFGSVGLDSVRIET